MPQQVKPNSMPYSLEAEQSILGSILIDMELQFEIMTKLKESDFYLESHKLIFSGMQSVFASNVPVDLVTLSDALEKSATLDKAGGIDYLTSLARMTPSAANYAYYLEIVKRDGTLRKLIRSADKISEDARNSSDHIKSVAFAEKCVYDISEELDTSTLANINTTFTGILEKFENIQKDKNYFQGLKTGFTGLDKLTNGLHAGNLIILAARPSIGKTTFAMNIVENIAIREKAVCAVFALEMTQAELGQRMMCSVANVSNKKALSGELDDDDWQRLWNSKKILSDTRIFVDDTSMTTCPEILSKCRRLKSREGRLDLIVVDHIQLMNAQTKSDSRQQEITEISRGLKMIAKELDIPVIALSQLSRQVTSRKGQEPVLSDLRESGAIEQDADIVMFIHRPDLVAEEKELEQNKVKRNVAQIILAKNRAGECNRFSLLFKGENSKFVNLPVGFADDIDVPPERPQRTPHEFRNIDDNVSGEEAGEVPYEGGDETNDVF